MRRTIFVCVALLQAWCVPRTSSFDVVFFLLFVVLLILCKYTKYAWVILSIRGFVFCVQLFNDAIIALLLSHFTPPFVGFVKIRPIANW